jgi:hypothetical protein
MERDYKEGQEFTTIRVAVGFIKFLDEKKRQYRRETHEDILWRLTGYEDEAREKDLGGSNERD